METNQKVNATYSNMQTPRVENKVLVIDDYSTYGRAPGLRGAGTRPSDPALPSVPALTMQILKPAGFVDTAQYPLLLLV